MLFAPASANVRSGTLDVQAATYVKCPVVTLQQKLEYTKEL